MLEQNAIIQIKNEGKKIIWNTWICSINQKRLLVNQIFTLTRRVSEYDVNKLATCATKVSQTSQDVFLCSSGSSCEFSVFFRLLHYQKNV